MSLKKCPRCGGEHFLVDAHIVQEWIVDTKGFFEEVATDCVEVIHKPNDEDVWQCESCGYEGEGKKFNVKE